MFFKLCCFAPLILIIPFITDKVRKSIHPMSIPGQGARRNEPTAPGVTRGAVVVSGPLLRMKQRGVVRRGVAAGMLSNLRCHLSCLGGGIHLRAATILLSWNPCKTMMEILPVQTSFHAQLRVEVVSQPTNNYSSCLFPPELELIFYLMHPRLNSNQLRSEYVHGCIRLSGLIHKVLD